jgi:hypothetical protein
MFSEEKQGAMGAKTRPARKKEQVFQNQWACATGRWSLLQGEEGEMNDAPSTSSCDKLRYKLMTTRERDD